MCTAIYYQTGNNYFGRNLDLEYRYHETVTVMPRKYQLTLRRQNSIDTHYAMIGMATVSDSYPLYYDATNEYGLSMAGLNFPGNAVYYPYCPEKVNIAPFELIPWVLSQCKNTTEARKLLYKVNILNVPFSDKFPLTPLHWIIADENCCIVVEPLYDGLHIYDNPVRVLTNSPPFPYHLQNLCNYRGLSSANGNNTFTDRIDLLPYSNGLGTFGLPGDLSSASRFVRAAFVLHNSPKDPDHKSSISQHFHILDSVSQKKGCNKVDGKDEITVYSSCCDTTRGIYYYTTYQNRQICAVDMNRENLDASSLVTYRLETTQNILLQNE